MSAQGESLRDTDTPIKIIAADRLNDGLVITFEDGQCGFYSAAYLYSKLAESDRLAEQELEW